MLNQLRDVFVSFQKYEVKYVVIGGIAAVLHGVPRATFDLDILIEATPDNARVQCLKVGIKQCQVILLKMRIVSTYSIVRP